MKGFKNFSACIKSWYRETKPEESIAKRVHLRRGYVAKIKREEKIINNTLFKEYFTNYQSPSNMYKKLRETESKRNEDEVYLR